MIPQLIARFLLFISILTVDTLAGVSIAYLVFVSPNASWAGAMDLGFVAAWLTASIATIVGAIEKLVQPHASFTHRQAHPVRLRPRRLRAARVVFSLGDH